MIFVLVIFLSSILAASAAAQSGKNFFEGKTITLFAGSSAGGGTDITARLIARHMERHIPGNPRILVANKPGAGGMIAVNELYNRSKFDGLIMSTMNTGSLFGLAIGNDALKFVNSDVGRELNLRGVNAKVVEPGTVRPGDAIRKQRPDS